MSDFLVTGAYILSDDIFVQYGGQTGTSTPAQRNAAYMIAEQGAIDEIGTFMVPTTVTGTFMWPRVNDYRMKLPIQRLISVDSVATIHEAGCNCADDSYELEGCAWVVDDNNGVIDLRECGNTIKAACSGCSCNEGRFYGFPYQVRIVYTAGFAEGMVASSPKALMGLVTAADIILEQILNPYDSPGGAGLPALKGFSDTGYSETYQSLKVTAFGGSARANFASEMLSSLKFKGVLKLR
jgi:hypothetical protein